MPSPPGAPSKIDPPPGEDLITVNFGPNHPSTHGVLRLIVTLDGEVVVGLDADIGYVHTGFEKNFEQKTYWKGIPYAPRMDYLGFFANELAYVGAVERLIEIEVPERAQWIRTLFAELNRHPLAPDLPGHLGRRAGRHVGLLLLHCASATRVLDLFEMVTGVRMHDRYPQFGGVAEDLPKGFYDECKKFCKDMPKQIDSYLDLLAEQPDLEGPAAGASAPSTPTPPSPWASRAPTCGPPASPTTCAATSRTWPTTSWTSTSSPRKNGDCYDRFLCRTDGDVRVGQDHRAVPRGHALGPGDGRRSQVRAAAAGTSCTPRWSR